MSPLRGHLFVALRRFAAWSSAHAGPVGLALALLLALALRLNGIGRPLVDHHSWRQCDSAAIARNFIEEDGNLLRPRIDWRGSSSGEVEWNFPIFSYLVSSLYRVFGEHEVLGRLLSVAFSLGAVVMLFLLARRTLGVSVAIASAAYMALNPLAVYFGRTFMPESMLLFAALAFLWAIGRWASEPATSWLLVAALGLAVAGLIKIPFGFLVVPAAWIVVQRRGSRGLLDWRLWLVGTLVLAAVVSWYAYARRLGQVTGLSYAPIWEVGGDKWGNRAVLLDAAFWRTIVDRFRHYVSPAGFAVIAVLGVGAAAYDVRARWVLAFLAGAFAYLLFIAGGHRAHTYYQLAFVPGAAVAVGLGLRSFSRWTARSRLPWRIALVTVALLLVGTGLKEGRKQLRRMGQPRADFVTAGEAASAITGPDDKIITVGDCCLSEAFYFARRKGWSAVGVSDADTWVEARREEGARAAVLLSTYDAPVAQVACNDPVGRRMKMRYPVYKEGKNFLVLDLHQALDLPTADPCGNAD